MTPDPFQGNRKPTPPAGVLRGPADADNFHTCGTRPIHDEDLCSVCLGDALAACAPRPVVSPLSTHSSNRTIDNGYEEVPPELWEAHCVDLVETLDAIVNIIDQGRRK